MAAFHLQVWNEGRGSRFFSILLQAKSCTEEQLGPLRGRTAWEKAAVDFGTQATMDGKVAVVYPNPSLRFCKYFDWQLRSTYPLFGKVGNGFGGMEIKGAQGVNVIKATAYPGRYVHHMKA